MGESTMTYAVWEWFMGRHVDELAGPYGFCEARPVWKTWWFLGSSAVVCIGLTWFFWYQQ
jgi:hypothetical protein